MQGQAPLDVQEKVTAAFTTWMLAHRQMRQLQVHVPHADAAADALQRQQDACTRLWHEVAGLREELARVRAAANDAQSGAGDLPVDILVVDDEPRNFVALDAVLDAPGYRLVRATSGEEALLAFATGEFACVILDVQMPGLTGFEVARLVAAAGSRAPTPILFLTAHYQEEQHALDGYASGAVDYVHKPFHPAVLRQKVHVFVELHRRERQLRRDAAHAPAGGAATDVPAPAALQEGDRRKHQFLSMLAHELRNPLAPISNAVQILRGPRQSPERTAWAVEVIGRQTAQMVRLVDDLLDVARIVQGRVAMERQPLALEAVVRQALESCAPQVQQRRQAITLDLPGQPVELRGDAARLAQALGNLVDNASRFSGADTTIAVTATCAHGQVRIAVRDAGVGIEPELLPHVFDLFAQGEQSLDRPQGGLGIGLALARHVVELHGGRIEATSAGTGQGTEVVVHLPGQPVVPAASDQAPAAIDFRPTRATGTPMLRVLVVDDEAASVETLQALLEIRGFDVRCAQDGLAALQAAASFRPDAVLLDIGLPGMSGFEVARKLRAQPHAQDALLIALTGYGDADTRARAARAGFDVHMTKPANLDRLLEMLARPRDAARREG